MTRIKKALITEFGDESKITVVQSDIGEPHAGEVQVKVEYSTVSRRRYQYSQGHLSVQKIAGAGWNT
jgi:NADPH:quinone reductase-like Zn-dependent oxidoreductase